MVFGGNTSCYALEINERLVILDCGSGAMSLNEAWSTRNPQRIDLLLGHMHLDHIVGIPFFFPFYSSACNLRVFGVLRDGKTTRDQLTSVFGAPFWPVGLDSFPSEVVWQDFLCGDTLDLGDNITVKTMSSDHPNQCSLFRIESCGKSVVYALDFEHGLHSADLKKFAAQCDLLIYDAQYTDVEYHIDKSVRGWGHSTWQEGVRLAYDCGARQLLLSHHHPLRTDDVLKAFENQLLEGIAQLPSVKGENFLCRFAREGQVIGL